MSTLTRSVNSVSVPRPRRRLRRLRVTSMPTRRDPRLPFAMLLTTYAVVGTLFLGFNRSPLQILLTVFSACVLDMGLHAVLRERSLLVPLSAYISSLSLSLLLNYAHSPYLLFLPVFLTIGSKYLLTLHGRHLYNPSMFGVVVTLLVSGGLITTAPAYQWGGTWAVSAFMVTAALALFVFRVDRVWLVASFLVFYALQTAFRAYVMRHHLPAEALFLGTISSPPFYLFCFFMLTDPRTSPSSRRGQVLTALAITLVDLALHLRESLFTFLYAAFVVATVKALYGHVAALRSRGVPARLREALSARFRLTVVTLTLLGVGGGVAYAGVLAPGGSVREPGFRLREVPAAESGLAVRVDRRTLDLVDPRLAHISKWLLSVGSAVAVADLNGDGREDVFVTHPFGPPQDRNALFLNEGGMRFRRDRPAMRELAALNADPRRQGLSSGALFFDYDSDGDRDLLLLVSFGRTRLLRNEFVQTGRVGFSDVSGEAGVSAYTIALAAAAVDYDRDGDLDVVVKNVMPPRHPGYDDRPVRLNIFDLPQPERPGDRRMFQFMHESWYRADNGGDYVLLRNEGGRFAQVDARAVGLHGTGWTTALGAADLNGDGRTDLYAANDFGPDELLVNTGGRFDRVTGGRFGTVGRDTYKGMNASLDDLDGDGRLDVYVSNVHQPLQAEGSLLWMNRGNDGRGQPVLRDEASRRGLLNEHRFGWGAGAGDLDNSGTLDLVQANGMVDDRLDRRADGCPDYWYVNDKLMQSGPEIHTYADMWGDLRGRCIFPAEQRRVYLNRGPSARPQFVDVASVTGPAAGENSRGVAVADLDGDGRLDVLVANQHGGPTLLHNEARGSASWGFVSLELRGDRRRCNADAIGSRVRLHGVPGSRVTEVQGLTGFSGQSSHRVHVGLGSRPPATVDVAIRWCGGETTRAHVPTGRTTVVRQ